MERQPGGYLLAMVEQQRSITQLEKSVTEQLLSLTEQLLLMHSTNLGVKEQ